MIENSGGPNRINKGFSSIPAMDKRNSGSEQGLTFGEMMRRDSKKYMIIFLDVLGYDDFISKHGDAELFASMEKMKRTLKAFFNPVIVNKKDGTRKKFEVGMKMYTDNILLYAELEDDGFDQPRCSAMISLLSVFQPLVMEECNLLLRGAITHGTCYIGEYIFGKPILDAIKMEKKATWPRVLISEETVEMYIPGELGKIMISRGDDNLPFFDYLNVRISFESSALKSNPCDILKRHKETVINLAKHTFTEKEMLKVRSLVDTIELIKISRNYGELTKYHNHTCDVYGCINEKMEECTPPNTFLEDYLDYLKTYNNTTHKNTKELEVSLEFLLETYKNMTLDIQRLVEMHNSLNNRSS